MSILKFINNKNYFLYHYDGTKINNIKIYTFVNIFKNYLKKKNLLLFSYNNNNKLKTPSSLWIKREVNEMFNVKNNETLYDSRRLLLDYNIKRGVLISWWKY